MGGGKFFGWVVREVCVRMSGRVQINMLCEKCGRCAKRQ